MTKATALGAALAVATGSYTPVMVATAAACLLGSAGLAAAAYMAPRLTLPEEHAVSDAKFAGTTTVAS